MMSKMASQFVFKPRDLKSAVENESNVHKARVVCFSLAMASVASLYSTYFDNLVMRSNQAQQAAMAGETGYEWHSYYMPAAWDSWGKKQTRDVLSDKGVKEIVQIDNDWKTMSYENGGRIYANPNGNPYDNEGYFTQTHRWYDSGYDEDWNEAQKEFYAMDPIERDAELYDQWYEMHSGTVMWFDTAACWKGKFIGDTTDIQITSDQSTNP
jgi:hypothetical protein